MKQNNFIKKLGSAFMAFMLTLGVIAHVSPEEVEANTQINRAVNWAVGIANDDRHGYDQTHRWGPDYDCSSLVISAWEKAGVRVKTNGATYTGNMKSVFLRTGFKDVRSSVNISNGSGLRKGDVLLNNGHTVMVISVSGSRVRIVHASGNEHGRARGGRTGDQTGREIRTQNYYNGGWHTVLRYGGGGNSNNNRQPQPTPRPSGTYFPRYTGRSGSIVDALKAVGANNSYSYRRQIAAANGIRNYQGTAYQNTQMLNLLKQGRLVRPGNSGGSSAHRVSYFPKYTGLSSSIVDALRAVGANNSYSYRARIAAKNGISNYSGTAYQNTRLLNLLKQGRLVRP